MKTNAFQFINELTVQRSQGYINQTPRLCLESCSAHIVVGSIFNYQKFIDYDDSQFRYCCKDNIVGIIHE